MCTTETKRSLRNVTRADVYPARLRPSIKINPVGRAVVAAKWKLRQAGRNYRSLIALRKGLNRPEHATPAIADSGGSLSASSDRGEGGCGA